MRLIYDNVFMIIGIVFAVIAIKKSLSSKQESAVKSLRKELSSKDRNTGRIVKIILTQRLFGLSDLRGSDKAFSKREMFFCVVFVLVIIVAVTWF